MVDLEALKLVRIVRKRNQWVNLLVVVLVVVLAFAVRQHQHYAAVKLLNLHIWSIGAIEDLEAVVKEALCLVVGNDHAFHREQGTWIVGVTGPNGSRSNEVEGTRSK